MGILVPEEINEKAISRYLSISLSNKKGPSYNLNISGIRAINVDSRKIITKQREQFFHELCHSLLHPGNQTKMAKTFKLLQENKAENFALHCAIPTFMLLKYEIANLDVAAGIPFIMDKFKVTEEFAKTRLRQFRNKLLQAKSDEELRKRKEPVYNYSKGIPPRKFPSHTNEIVERALAFKKNQAGVFN
ncbi:Zn-dependent peptidase ImmA (M78 family) [Bacillus pakistanensis]|uniref:Zn-dependent peptidase ImmA (M78 family) n=1 Tax=Rossellomorea pakistanensis TaxID=992288 RepID=A0ABS2ND59_9BACI|nr:ImmA/IrrE family metallo-endopeptidase [Bacillus pakistanensis]MBM7585797.1 Zn-dependent peptidase ImmA (M78 family) [Bacillus pakistanensis]